MPSDCSGDGDGRAGLLTLSCLSSQLAWVYKLGEGKALENDFDLLIPPQQKPSLSYFVQKGWLVVENELSQKAERIVAFWNDPMSEP